MITYKFRARKDIARIVLIVLAVATVVSGSVLGQSKPSPRRPGTVVGTQSSTIRLQFVNTDISDVLQAISMKTGANIVYSALLKRPISINMTASSVSEAIGFAASAAGITFKEMNKRYFVASPADLKQLVESFGVTETLELRGLPSADAVALLSGAIPYLTVRPAGQQLIVVGDRQDIAQAKLLIESQTRPAGPVQNLSEVVAVKWLVPSQAATLLQTLYPAVKAEAIGGEKSGGAVGLFGPMTEVKSAKDTLTRLDATVPTGLPSQPEYKVYAVKYSGAEALKLFIEKAVPGISAVVGPDHSVPPAPKFSPLSGASTTASSSSGGSSSGSSTSTGSSDSSSGGSGGTPSAGGSSGKVSQENDRAAMLVLSGTDVQLGAATRLLDAVDIAPIQVMIDVRVVDISPSQSQDLGVTWNWSPLTLIEAPVGAAVAGTALTTPTTVPNHFGVGLVSRVPLTAQATLNAMITNKTAKLLANPRIQVLDKDDANIFIGDTLRTQVSQSGISGTTVQVYEFPVGIILLVRPRVNADGFITMHVHPVVSTITGMGAGNLPQTSSREAETTVRVHDGETVVIGGLIRDEMSKVVQSVPILSKLPLVGELFKSTSTDHTHSEIMVFITPHIVK